MKANGGAIRDGGRVCRKPSYRVTLPAPQDWALVNPEKYFNWHRDFGVNCMFCQADTHTGYGANRRNSALTASRDTQSAIQPNCLPWWIRA
jgi:hypothetical protein